MTVHINNWLRAKAERFRNLVDNSPHYNCWDAPTEVTAGLSESTVESIRKEVYLLDVEEFWGPETRRQLEDSMRKKNARVSNIK